MNAFQARYFAFFQNNQIGSLVWLLTQCSRDANCILHLSRRSVLRRSIIFSSTFSSRTNYLHSNFAHFELRRLLGFLYDLQKPGPDRHSAIHIVDIVDQATWCGRGVETPTEGITSTYVHSPAETSCNMPMRVY